MRNLQQAISLINQTLSTLDDTESTCTCCGRNSYANWTEHQAATELAAIVRKLQRWDAALSAEADPT